MSDTDALVLLLLAAWVAGRLSALTSRVGRIADAMEALRAIAERNRR